MMGHMHSFWEMSYVPFLNIIHAFKNTFDDGKKTVINYNHDDICSYAEKVE